VKPFVPKWLDDSDLTPVQFRVLTHLWRRADSSGSCWPSGPSIASACRINRDSVWPAIAILEARGFLDREKAFRNSNRYILRVGGKEGVTQEDESAEKEGLQSAESEGLHPAESRGLQSAEKEGCKGNPYKETQRRNTNEGKKRAASVTDDDWLASLKSDPLHAGIDIDHEFEKAAKWIAARPPRKFTRKFFTGWLSRAEKPLAITTTPRALNLGKRGLLNGYNERRDF
jgi:DNA-binding MarR family transcriptional regulator